MEETRWFLEKRPWFSPGQLLAVDYCPEDGKGSIKPEKARKLGVPRGNIFLDYPLKNALQMLRVSHKVAVINADTTYATTMDSMRVELAPLVVSLKRCCDKVGECFLFFNSAAEIINSPRIRGEARETYRWLDEDMPREYFDEPEYRGLKVRSSEWYTYRGISATTRMFCFCLHLTRREGLR
jgi:hypothetical protein